MSRYYIKIIIQILIFTFTLSLIFFNTTSFALAIEIVRECPGAQDIQCAVGENGEKYEKKIPITVGNPNSPEGQCQTYTCADSCPPLQLKLQTQTPYYYCGEGSTAPVPNIPKDSIKTEQYSAYTCVNYTCIGLEEQLPPIPETVITSFETYLKYIYQIALGIVGLTALIFIIIGGVMYMTAAGNVSQATEAKNRIQSALLGLILALSAYLILYTINPNLVRLSKVQIQYPVLPKVILTCENNACVSKVVQPNQITAGTVNTCGEVGTTCPPGCKLVNAYWNKQKAGVGDTVKLIIEAKGACDNVPLTIPSIYDKSIGPTFIPYIPIDTNISLPKFKRGFPYHTAEVMWTVKKPSTSWWFAFRIFDPESLVFSAIGREVELEYIAQTFIVDKNIDGRPQQYYKNSSILKVDASPTTKGSGGEQVNEGMIIVGDCVGKVSWDRKVAYQGDVVKWNATLKNCEDKKYEINETLSIWEKGFSIFNKYEPFSYGDTADQAYEEISKPFTVQKFEGTINLQLTVDGKKSDTVSLRVTRPEAPTIQ